MCQRNLAVPVRWLVAIGIVGMFVMLLGFLWASGRFKSRLDKWLLSSPQQVLTETQALVARSPTVHNPVKFSSLDQTTVEHWDGRRWRVSGYVDTKPQPGVNVRTLYFAVVQQNGKTWDLEDLQLQNTDFPGAAAKKR